MTIKLLAAYPFGRHLIPAGATVSVFDAPTETGLVANKLAVSSVAEPDWVVPTDVNSPSELAVAVLLAALPVTSTWANRAALVAVGSYTAFFTDIGVGGSVWTYSGGRWRPYLGRVRLKSLTVDVSNSAAPKVVLDYATLPAGIWQDGDTIECSIVKDRTGGTSDTDATDVMLGIAPTTLGTSLLLSTSALATTQISMSTIFKWRRVSSTSVRSQSVAGSVGFGVATSANGLQNALPNLDSVETYLQVTSDLSTAGGEVSWLRGFTVDLIAGA